MANLDDLIIRIKTILDSGGLDSAADKVKRVESQVENSSKTFNKLGASGASSFMQIQYGADNALSNVNRNMQSISSNSSGLWNNIKSGASSTWGTIKSGASSAFSSFKAAGESAINSISKQLKSLQSAASGFLDNLSGVDGVVTGVLGGIGLNSIYDTVVGTSSKAEVNKVLLNNMTQTKKGAETLFNTVDQATNKTLVSMQQVIPALNAFKASTGATESQLNTVTPGVAQFGSYVYAMTGSSAQAETAMFDLSKGIKGMYASLDQYGITEASLMDTGLWSGKEDDVQGYIAAVNQVTGDTDALMGTFQGMQATIGKLFSSAGKKLGAFILPILKSLIQGFMGLNDMLGGNLAPAILLVGGAITLLATGAGILGALLPAITAGFGMMGTSIGVVTGALGINTFSLFGNNAAKAIAIGEAAAHASALGVETTTTAAATAATWGLNTALLASPIFWIAAVILGVAAAIIVLKTQTNLLSSVTEKGARAMDSMNQRLELLKGQEQAVANKTSELKDKLDTLTEGTHEYTVTWKNYEAEKSKLADIRKEIKEIEGIKGSGQVESAKWDTTNLEIGKIKQGAYSGTGVTPHTPTSSENIMAYQKSIGQSAYYRDLTLKTVTSLNKLSDAQKKTYDGKNLAKYSKTMEGIGELEEKAYKLAQDGKELDWFDQAKLANLKKDADEIAGVNPWDSEQTRVAKREAVASGDYSKINDGNLLSAIGNLFNDADKALIKGWNDFSKWITDGADKIGQDFYKGIDDAGAWVNGAWQNTTKWFDEGTKWITEGYNRLKQTVLTSAAILTQNVPLLGDFFKNLEGNGGDVGGAIKKTIDNIDWNKLGSDIGSKLIEGIKGMLESMPIIQSIMKLLEGGQGGGLNLGNIKLPEFKWPEWPAFTWPQLPTFTFPSLPKFSWPTLPKWKWPTLPKFSWPKLPTWSWPSIPMPSWLGGGAGYEGYINEDYGKGSYYEGNSTSSSYVSSSSVVRDNSSSNSIVDNRKIDIKVEVKGDVDSSSRANELAENVIKEATLKLNKFGNANGY